MRLQILLAAFLLACTPFESPSQRARTAVERVADQGITLGLPSGGELRIPPGGLAVLAMDAYKRDGGGLQAFAQLSLEGEVGGVSISYLGNEKMEFSCGARACSLRGPLADRLVEVAAALVERRRALEEADLQGLARLSLRPGPVDPDAVRQEASREARAWFVRVENEEAVVGEAGPDGVQRRLLLRRGQEGWRFAGGVP